MNHSWALFVFTHMKRKFDLLAVNEVAEALGRSQDFIRDEIAKGKLAHHRIGGRIFVTEEDLAEYVTRSRIAAYGERPVKRKEAV
jgi:excisionase family DNA binding protein